MKTNLVILIMTLASLLARAQIVTIPDANLKNALVNSSIADLGNGINEIADTNGLLFIKIETDKGFVVKKVVKE